MMLLSQPLYANVDFCYKIRTILIYLLNRMQLQSLKPGQQATIASIEAEQALYQRLNALGFRCGKVLQVMRQAAFGGPLHVRIGSTDVMIRTQDAACIQIEPSSLTQSKNPS